MSRSVARRRAGSPLLVLIAALLIPQYALAQTFRGSIQGTVTDTSGGALVGAQVTVGNPAIGLTRTVATDPSGNYFIAELPVGDYSVTAVSPGLRAQTITGVHVEVGTTHRVDLQLASAGVQETVEVLSASPLVRASGNVLGGTVSGREALDLPINGRDYTKLLLLVPGAVGDASGAMDSPGSFGLFSINGARGRSNNYLLDGTDMNDGYRNLPAINQAGVFGTPATVLPLEALAEVRVLSSTDAEYGRNAGAIVNIVTRSGTNQVRASAFEYFRDEALDARNYFNAPPQSKNEFRNQQFGGSAGGPLSKDRMFWFGAYEGQREHVGIPSLARVPDPAVLARATNPVIRQLVARNPWPVPNIAGAGPDEPNLQARTRASNRVDSVIVKVDRNLAEGDLLTARYFAGDSDQSFPLALLGGNVLPGFNTVTPTTVHLVSASYVNVLSSRWLAEVRGGYNRFDESFFPEDRGFNPASVGLNTGVSARDTGLPLIRIAGYAPIGANASVPRGRVDTNWHGVGMLAFSTGRHNMKMGYEYRRTTVDGFFDPGYRGVLDFATIDDFLRGSVTNGRQAKGPSDRTTFQNNHAAYWQDNFARSPRMTLTFGGRWDYFGVLTEEENRFSILDARRGLIQVGTSGLDGLYPRDLNNLSGRAAIVYDLTGVGRTVVRAGWGVYYDAFSQDFFVGQLPFNTFNSGPAYNPFGPAPILFSFSPDFTLAPNRPAFAPESFGDSDVFTVDQELATPYMHHYSANVQRQIGDRAAVHVGYVGSIGRKLFRYRDINQADPVTAARPFDRGPFAPSGNTFVYVNQFESTATSTYNALQASLNIRGWRGLTTKVHYTLSHSRDNASDGQDYVPNASQPDNSFDPAAERADSNFDARQRFAWTFSYEVPTSPRLARVRWLTAGWSLDGVVTLMSGMPFNVNYLFEDDYNGSGEFFGRPDLVGDPFVGTSGAERYLNLGAFAVPCRWDPRTQACVPGSGHFGNLPRNAFTGPDYRNVDLSFVKTMAVRQRARLQLRFDVFNIFNRVNLANPLLPSFGIDFLANGIDPATGRGVGFLPITATPDVAVGNPFLGGGGPRNVQIALRVSY